VVDGESSSGLSSLVPIGDAKPGLNGERANRRLPLVLIRDEGEPKGDAIKFRVDGRGWGDENSEPYPESKESFFKVDRRDSVRSGSETGERRESLVMEVSFTSVHPSPDMCGDVPCSDTSEIVSGGSSTSRSASSNSGSRVEDEGENEEGTGTDMSCTKLHDCSNTQRPCW
jgi:hypothetical protein